AQGTTCDVVTIDIDQIEYMKDQTRRGTFIDRVLQSLKTRTPLLIERDNLAVENRTLQRQRLHSFANCRKLRGPVFPVSGPETKLTPFEMAKQTVAVKLQFM